MITVMIPRDMDYTARPMRDDEKPGFQFTERPITEKELKEIGPHATAEACELYGYHAASSCIIKEHGMSVELGESTAQRVHILTGERGHGWFHFPDGGPERYEWVHVGQSPDRTIYGLAQLRSAYIRTLKCKIGRLPFVVWCRGTRSAIDAAGLGMLPLWRPEGNDMPSMDACVHALKLAKAIMVPCPPYGTKEWDAAVEGLLKEDTSGCLVITNYGEQKGGGR